MSFEDGPLDREWAPTEEEWNAMESKCEPNPEYTHFDAESYCIVHLRPNSGIVQMMSNIADRQCAQKYAQQIELDGGHVFALVPAGVLVAALQLIKKEKRK